jgi:hypothetical protein
MELIILAAFLRLQVMHVTPSTAPCEPVPVAVTLARGQTTYLHPYVATR